MPLSKEKMRDYQRERRKKKHREMFPQIGEDAGDDGRYPDRGYEGEALKLFEQRCVDGCGGLWSASIAVPCPYCRGTGKRLHQ